MEQHPGLYQNIFQLEPDYVVITTPNKDFNKYFNMQPHEVRDPDHKFEFTQQDFHTYCNTWFSKVADNYIMELTGIEYPNPKRIEKQYKYTYSEFKDVPATLMV